MNNITFLENINALIVCIDSKYYAYIPNILGGYNDNGYYKGIYVLLNKEFLNEENLETYVTNYIDSVDLNTNENIYFSNSLKDNDAKSIQDITNDIIVNNTNNYTYYATLNEINNEFSIEEIDNTYKTFALIIQDYSYITDISILTQIYKKIIEFYANGQTDTTLVNLRLILESSSYNYTNTSNFTSCGCNSSNSLSNNGTSTESLNCSESYLHSIQMYMIQMFGDLNFYYNFFFLDNNEPNEEMINYLITLLEDVLEKLNNYQSIGNNVQNNHCKCPNVNTVDTNTQNIILNYIKVLNWVKNCEIEENKNKIKVYGNQFGEIFPNLYFV